MIKRQLKTLYAKAFSKSWSRDFLRLNMMGANILKFNFKQFTLNQLLIVALDYSWLLFSFPPGGTCVSFPPLCELVAPSFPISGIGMMLARDLFKYACSGFGRLRWGG